MVERDQGVGEQGVLHSEGFIFAGMFEGAAINFERFDDLSRNASKVCCFGWGAEDIDDKGAGSDVPVRGEEDK